MRRREFIAGLGLAAVWPIALRGQQGGRARRIGMLLLGQENTPNSRAGVAVFRDALRKLGWVVGRNLEIDYHWVLGDAEEMRTAIAELLAVTPDVIVTAASPTLAAAKQATQTIPIVFIFVSDPVGQGFVQSLARPGGNITGFSNVEESFATKWVEMLKEIAPHLTRVSIMINPDNSGPVLLARSAAAAAPMLGLEAVLVPIFGPAEIEPTIAKLARDHPGGGLILPPDGTLTPHQKLIAELAARFGLPAIADSREFTVAGGLVSYGINRFAHYRQAAPYVDRILKGEKPSDLAVQQPTKFELVINLKTAKGLGLTVPNTLLVSADEVIE
jgi:putative ABC transport system substrate-binding protein